MHFTALFRLKTRILAVCATTLLTIGNIFAQTGSFVALTNVAPHNNAGVMLVLTDGTILCKTDNGGGDGIGNTWDRLTPVNGSYQNGTWTTIAPMAKTRLYFSTQVLPDGRVYVSGGEYGTGGASGEFYNPATDTWTPLSGGITYPQNISDANSEILPDGRILQAWVDAPGINQNLYWNQTTNTYSTAPSCLRVDNEGAWVKLQDSSILFLDNYSTTSERFIPQTGTWINDATAPVNIYDPYGSEAGGGYLLPNGKAFFIGSTPTTLYYTPSGSTAPGTWAAGPAIPNNYGAPDAASGMLPNGKILMALSPTATAADHFPSITKYYEFDYTTNTFTLVLAPGGVDSLLNPAYISNMVTLPDGNILYCNQGDNQYYLYVAGTGPLPAGKPTLSAIKRLNCDTFQITGTLFNGICEGSSYGDDWQMSTNYPIVRLTNGTNTYYATTYNWNRIGAVMTGVLPDTAIFALPAGLPVGTYSVVVVANGNPSAPSVINTALTITPATMTLCLGSSVTFTDATTGGIWSSANSSIASVGAGTGVVTGAGLGNTTITYTIGTCTATASVTVLPATAGTISGTLSVCQGLTTTLAETVTGGTWSSGTTSVATISTGGVVSGASGGTSTIFYTPLAGCAATAVVTVNSLPVATITPVGSTTFCSGGSVTLDATTGGGYIYQWLNSGTLITGATSTSYMATTGGNYSLAVTNSTGCHDTSTTTTVTISPTLSSMPATTLLATACASGSTIIYSAFLAGATSYGWSLSGTGWASSVSTTTDSLIATVGTGGATISCWGINGCGVGPTTTFAFTPAIPAPASPIAATTGICEGGVAIFITSAIAGATSYVWIISGTGWVPIPSTTTMISATVGTGPATVTVYGVNGCGSGPSYTLSSVEPVAIPTSTFTIANHVTTTGSGDLVTYTGTASTFGTYTWDFGGGTAVPGTGAGPQLVSWSTTGLKTITLSVSDTGCTSPLFSDTVLVTPVTGFETITGMGIQAEIYPNPSAGSFCILLSKNVSGISSIKMTDIQGREVYTFDSLTTGNFVLPSDASQLEDGIYFITIVTNEGVINRKVIINK